MLSEKASPNCDLEMVIDLHGFSAEQAKFRVLYTLAQANNVNKIRIITGRGNHLNKSGERGLLYKELRSWLTESKYQTRIANINTYDGYYEINLRGNTPFHDFNQTSNILFKNLFPNIEAIKEKAEKNDPSAQFVMGAYLTDGAKDEKDFNKAFEYMLKSAKAGYPDAMISVARCYMVGRGTRQNDTNAVVWLEKALKVGHVEAPLLLGDSYWCGYGVAQDPYRAVSYYQMGAEKDDPVAMRKLASAYNTGIGVKQKDCKKSFELYKKAADLGEVTSQYNVAVAYEQGHGVKIDLNEAYKYYLLAANGGDPDAQCNLSTYFYNGTAVPVDKEKAKYWVKLAASNGSSQAFELLKHFGNLSSNEKQQSAQAGNIFDLIDTQIQERGLANSPEILDALFQENYLKLREIPVEQIILLEDKTKFFLIDSLLTEKTKSKKRHQQKALKALNIMAEGNCIYSIRRLAYIYHHGVGVNQDNKKMLNYLELARKLKDGKSTLLLSDIIKRESLKKSITLLEESALFGYPPANYFYGLLLFDGNSKIEQSKCIHHLRMSISLELSRFHEFSSGFLDSYSGIKSEAAMKIGAILCNDPIEMRMGLRYIKLAELWGNKDAIRFVSDAEDCGALVGIPHDWLKAVEKSELLQLIDIDPKEKENMFGKSAFFSDKLDVSKAPQELLEKYKRPDNSIPSLEYGLRLAAALDRVDDLREFLKYNINIDAQGMESKKTALHYAVLHKNAKCVEILLNAGANACIRDKDNKTPAEYQTSDEIKRILESYKQNKF